MNGAQLAKEHASALQEHTKPAAVDCPQCGSGLRIAPSVASRPHALLFCPTCDFCAAMARELDTENPASRAETHLAPSVVTFDAMSDYAYCVDCHDSWRGPSAFSDAMDHTAQLAHTTYTHRINITRCCTRPRP